MLDRQEYDAAIDLYKEAQEYIGDDTLFLNELANTYMQAGRFEESVQQYFRLIINSPDQMSLVQQRFLRMRDNNLYQIAAFELEDQLMDLDFSHGPTHPLSAYLTWLLMETEEYQRAFVFARQYENQTSYTIHALLHWPTNCFRHVSLNWPSRLLNITWITARSLFNYRAKEELGVALHSGCNTCSKTTWKQMRAIANFIRKLMIMNETLLENAPDYERADRVIPESSIFLLTF
jgi:tetratricopeptide (TPR) repeat protein